MKKVIALSAAFALLGVAGSAAAAGDVAAGKQNATTVCVACHGADGNSVNPQWPSLAGQHASYIVKQLHDLKAGKTRSNPLMSPQAAGLSDQDMENVAAYFATQKINTGSADKTKAAAGEKLYRGGDKATGVPACMACHGPDGAGNESAMFPALHGQHADYVVLQLKAFRDGSRSNDINKMMRDIASKMTDKQMADVAAYINGLH